MAIFRLSSHANRLLWFEHLLNLTFFSFGFLKSLISRIDVEYQAKWLANGPRQRSARVHSFMRYQELIFLLFFSFFFSRSQQVKPQGESTSSCFFSAIQ